MKKRLSVKRLLSLLLSAGVVCMSVAAWQEQTVYAQAKAETDAAEGTQEDAPSVHAAATSPSSATAVVTEHTQTDTAESAQGKEFYTIQTASEKVFYLIIDRDGAEEVVYFLTEISENDLLNVTADGSITAEAALSASESFDEPREEEEPEDTEPTEEAANADTVLDEQPEETPAKTEHPILTYLILGVFAAGAVGVCHAFRTVKKRDAQFLDEDDDEDEEEEELFEDDEEESDSEEDFFADEEREEDK